MSFEILNNFFDRIFVVTLLRATERQSHIQRELEGLNYEFYLGKDQQEYSIEALENKKIYSERKARHFHRYTKSMTLGHICCSWSHLSLYEKIADEKLNKVLILEDDVVIIKESCSYIAAILEQLPPDWNLLYLGWEKHENITFALKIKQWYYHFMHAASLMKGGHKHIGNLYPQKYSANLMYAGFHDCTHAYAITLPAAEKLKELQTPIGFNADSLLAYAITHGLLNAFIAIPKIFNQLSQYGKERSHSFITG